MFILAHLATSWSAFWIFVQFSKKKWDFTSLMNLMPLELTSTRKPITEYFRVTCPWKLGIASFLHLFGMDIIMTLLTKIDHSMIPDIMINSHIVLQKKIIDMIVTTIWWNIMTMINPRLIFRTSNNKRIY